MPGLAAALYRLPHWLPPRQCEVCLQWSGAGADGVCADCVARWAAPLPRCARCGLRLGQPAAACGECLRHPPPFEGTVCAVDYGFPWDRLVGRFKFNAQAELASVLATRMLAAVQTAAAPRPGLLLPVPLSAPRLAERGYNQAWELARRIASRLRLATDPTLLLRPLDTAHQAELDRAQRQRNLRTAFMVDARRRGEIAGRRVALVDDVMTTGATAREAAAVLLRAGAAAVDVWVFARTPPH